MVSRTLLMAVVGMAALSQTSCVSRGIPSHGGGKRFYVEQDLISTAAKECIDSFEWSALDGKTVQVQIYSVGDEGGGTQSGGGGFDFFGLFGGGAGFVPAGSSGVGGSVSAQSEGSFKYAANAVANAKDIEYLKGLIIQKIHNAGGGVKFGDGDDDDGVLYIIVDAFGIDNSEMDILVYSELNLKAKVAMSSFFLPRIEGTDKFERMVLLSEGTRGDSYYKQPSIFGISLETSSDIPE